MDESLALITTARISETLGVSKQSVRTWCRLGLLPATRPRGTRTWRITEEDFQAWLQSDAGRHVTDFLDDSHRSTASEAELLADAADALARSAPARS